MGRIIRQQALVLLVTATASVADATAQVRPDTVGRGMAWRINTVDTTGVVAGFVFRSDGQPLHHVQVWIPGTGYGAITDSIGRFSFKPPRAGTWLVEAISIGYNRVADTVFIGDGTSVFMTVTMTEAAMHACGLVVCAGGAGSAGCKDLNVTVVDSITDCLFTVR